MCMCGWVGGEGGGGGGDTTEICSRVDEGIRQ